MGAQTHSAGSPAHSQHPPWDLSLAKPPSISWINPTVYPCFVSASAWAACMLSDSVCGLNRACCSSAGLLKLSPHPMEAQTKMKVLETGAWQEMNSTGEPHASLHVFSIVPHASASLHSPIPRQAPIHALNPTTVPCRMNCSWCRKRLLQG